MFSPYSYLNMDQYKGILLFILCSSHLVECVWLLQICFKGLLHIQTKRLYKQ